MFIGEILNIKTMLYFYKSLSLQLARVVNFTKRNYSGITPGTKIYCITPLDEKLLKYAREALDEFKQKLPGIISDPNNRHNHILVEIEMSLHPKPVVGYFPISKLRESIDIDFFYLYTLKGAVENSNVRDGQAYTVSSVKIGVVTLS